MKNVHCIEKLIAYVNQFQRYWILIVHIFIKDTHIHQKISSVFNFISPWPMYYVKSQAKIGLSNVLRSLIGTWTKTNTILKVLLRKARKRYAAMLHWKIDGVSKLISNVLDYNCAKFHKKCSYTSKDIECV